METYGGAERVTEEMARAFPAARVTAIPHAFGEPSGGAGGGPGGGARPSPAARVPATLGRPWGARRMGIEDRFASVLPPRPRLLRGYRALTPLFPAIVRANAIEDADVLLSSSYAFAHFFRPAGEAPHVCYCHSPLRFAWSMTAEYRDQRAGSAPARVAFEGLAGAMRHADAGAARRVDRYLTQSPYVAGLIERAYHRSADVIGAPVDCDLFRPAEDEPEGFYLLCGRLIEPYKRMDIVLEAFASLPGERLVVAGDGPAMGRLRAMAPANVEFRGHLADTELVPLM